jgi:hypothetical protein
METSATARSDFATRMYDKLAGIVHAIETSLGQTAEGGIGIAAAVIKELLQKCRRRRDNRGHHAERERARREDDAGLCS